MAHAAELSYVCDAMNHINGQGLCIIEILPTPCYDYDYSISRLERRERETHRVELLRPSKITIPLSPSLLSSESASL